jgi:hypothetical protein
MRRRIGCPLARVEILLPVAVNLSQGLRQGFVNDQFKLFSGVSILCARESAQTIPLSWWEID